MMEYGILHRIPCAYRTEAVQTKTVPTNQEIQPGYTKNTKWFPNRKIRTRCHLVYNQTGLTVKIHSNHDSVRATVIMLRSIAASSSCDLRSSQWSKLQKLHRPPFEWKNNNLLWYPFRYFEWKATSVTAAEFYGAVIPSDLDYVSCFSLHFFRALAASCVLYNRKEHSQGFSIC